MKILDLWKEPSLPPPEVVWDRKEASYRRSGTVEGGL